MKKSIIFILLVILFTFILANKTFALGFSSFGKVFGGRIIATKAKQIAILEASDYKCAVYGTSISVVPIGSSPGTPTDFFIPIHVTSQTRTTPQASKLILSRYGTPTLITCIFPGLPPEIPPDIKTVSLPTIYRFGTSR